MVNKYYDKQRYKRERLINRYLNGDGYIINDFVIDKGIKMGLKYTQLRIQD